MFGAGCRRPAAAERHAPGRVGMLKSACAFGDKLVRAIPCLLATWFIGHALIREARPQEPIGQKVAFGQSVVDQAGLVWQTQTVRDEVCPDFYYVAGRDGHPEQWIIRCREDSPQKGWWQSVRTVEPGLTYRFRARLAVRAIEFARRAAFARLVWLGEEGKTVHADERALGPYHPQGAPTPATPEWPIEQGVDEEGGRWLEGIYRVPRDARKVRIELHLQWVAGGEARWSNVSFDRCTPPERKIVRLATVHYRPSGKSPQANREEFAPLIAEAARLRADLVVLPETLTFYGTGLSYVECAEPVPGPSTAYFGKLAQQHRVHLVVGLLERDRSLVYNVAVLIGPDGRLIGKYRKVCLPRGELDGGITPGDAYPVFDTQLGRIGMMVCYDGFFPEVARRLAEAGAEIIAFPVWGCNPVLVAARACENQVYIVSSTYTDVSQNWMISGIYGHDGSVLARAEKFGSVAVAEVDLQQRTFWAGLGDFRAEVHRHRPPSAYEYVQAVWSCGQVSESLPTKVLPQWLPVAERHQISAARGGATDTTQDIVAQGALRIAPREPADALRSFHTRDGFRMELVACEPSVVDPVAMEYDEFGRAYVAEMRDYPYTDKSTDVAFKERVTDKPLGRIRLLEDRDGDGTWETSTVFAEDLSWPTGLALWQGGVFVAATPDIWYLKDTDGDGRADIRQRVYTGFRKYNVQAVINNLRWGLDHRIYGAGSSNGGSIVMADRPQMPPIRMGIHDFRFDPKTGRLELLSGGGRFGQSFDDWGNRFICNIRNPIRHAVFPDEAARRNPRVAFPPGVVDVALAGDTIPVYRTSPPEPWRIENARRLASDRASGSPRSETVAAGYMTSACGLTIYRGSAYPADYYGQAFLGEVAGNLIHRQRLIPDGVTFRSERIDEQTEFVTSDDNWFRPVNFVNAPDGTLHVLDMYRETIEHPWSIPDDLKAQLDLESGRDRGRIYRLAPPGFQYHQPVWPGRLSTRELVGLLDHPNGWHRDTAFRLIYERQDPSAIELLRSRLQQPPADGPVDRQDAIARVLALWSLEGLDALTDQDIRIAYEHPHPYVREHAVLLAGRKLSSKQCREILTHAVHDEALRVAYQAVLAAGTGPQVDRAEIVRQALIKLREDRWWYLAILSTAHGFEAQLLEEMLHHNLAADSPISYSFITLVAECVGATATPEQVSECIAKFLNRPKESRSMESLLALISGLDTGAARRGKRLIELVADPVIRDHLERLVNRATTFISDLQQRPELRASALHLIRQMPWPKAADIFVSMMSAREPNEVQNLAVRLALSYKDVEALQSVIGQYRRLSPAARTEALSQLTARPATAHALLEAIEAGRIPAADLSPGQCAVLIRSLDQTVQERARRLLAASTNARQQVIEQYRMALPARGDPTEGRQVFARSCASCHRVHGMGSDVGPPLETVLHRSIDELLVAILDPSREVAPNYQEYLAVLDDGRTVTGMIAEESPTTITLRRAGQQQDTIARAEVQELISTGKSLMPEGLERDIDLQQMADLLAFLRQPALEKTSNR